MMIKGRNSGRNKITHNKGNFRDGVCLKPLKGFEWKSLCMMIMTYRLLMKVKLSNFFQGWPLWTSYIIEQSTGSGFNTDKKGSKNCFKMVCWTVPYLISIMLCQISSHRKDFGDFQYQCKKCKKMLFFGLAVWFLQLWILKFYAVFLSVTMCSRDMQWNWTQIMSFQMYGTVFAFFCIN